MNTWDLLGYGTDFAIKDYVKRELIRDSIDVDNWQREAASVLSGAIGSLMGGVIAGPVGFLLGAMLSLYSKTLRYSGDRDPEEVRKHYREVAIFKAITRSVRIIADYAPDNLEPRFRQAFYDAHERLKDTGQTALNCYDAERIVYGVLASVDIETARKFDRLLCAAKELIG